MSSETLAEPLPSAPPALRHLVFVLGFVGTLFWLLVARESVLDALLLAKGVRLGLYTTLVFVLLVWPAIILAICNVMIRPALALLGAAAAIYATVAFLCLPKLGGPVPLLTAALFAILAGTWQLFGRGESVTERPFEDARRRIAVLYVAGLGTVVWLTSFVPAMTAVRSSGFEIIPAFYGTIFFVSIVLPLMTIGLGGSERRHEVATTALLVLTLAVTAIFGAPQLVQ